MDKKSAEHVYQQAVDRSSHLWYAESTFNAFRVAEGNQVTQKEINRPKELQDLVFPGFDQIAVTNILTVKPGMKLDYKFFRS